MKKVFAILALVALAGATGFMLGHKAGVHHAIYDSVIWTVDHYDPDNPDESAWGIFDQKIFIELDSQVFEHGMYQG